MQDASIKAADPARAYLYGTVDLPEFVRTTFDATEIECSEFGPQSAHVEMRICQGSNGAAEYAA